MCSIYWIQCSSVNLVDIFRNQLTLNLLTCKIIAKKMYEKYSQTAKTNIQFHYIYFF